MSTALLLSVAGLGLLDSINPSLFIAQFVLLATPKPTVRVIAYILGGVLAYFVGGVLILSGFNLILQQLLTRIEPSIGYALVLVLGVVLLVFGLRVKAAPQPDAAPVPLSLAPIHTFFLGIVLIGSEVTTALPYFAALERIAQAELGLLASVVVLGVYNFIFSLPMFGFLGAFLVLRHRVLPYLERIGATLMRWSARLVKWGSLLGGAALIAHGGWYFLTGRPLF